MQKFHVPFQGGDGVGYTIVGGQYGRWVAPFVYFLMIIHGLSDGFELSPHVEHVSRYVSVHLYTGVWCWEWRYFSSFLKYLFFHLEKVNPQKYILGYIRLKMEGFRKSMYAINSKLNRGELWEHARKHCGGKIVQLFGLDRLRDPTYFNIVVSGAVLQVRKFPFAHY